MFPPSPPAAALRDLDHRCLQQVGRRAGAALRGGGCAAVPAWPRQLPLAAVAAACGAAEAAVETHIGEVTDQTTMAAWLAACERVQPLDLVIANAGISGGTAGGPEGAEQVRRVFAVNVDGVLNTVLPAAAAMTARGQGQIAIMSSIAGFLGLPNAPAYCASKAAVKTLGEGMRGPWPPPASI